MSNKKSLVELFELVSNGLHTRSDYLENVSQHLLNLHELLKRNDLCEISLNLRKEELVISLPIQSQNLTRTLALDLDYKNTREASFYSLAMNGYERMFSSLFFTIAESSQCFFDVGANIGYYSVGSLLINPNMRVVSFEPNPINAKRLTNNFLRNQVLKNYEIYNVAIGEKDSSLTLREPTTVGGAGSTLVDLYSEYRETFEVSLKSLDNSFLDSTCDLIKVDVEGYEKNVVDGAIGFLDKNKPVIFIELLRKWMKPLNHHPNQVLDLLQRTGYVCYAIGETNLTPIDKVHDDTEETNFVFVHAGDSRLKVFEEYTTIKGV